MSESGMEASGKITTYSPIVVAAINGAAEQGDYFRAVATRGNSTSLPSLELFGIGNSQSEKSLNLLPTAKFAEGQTPPAVSDPLPNTPEKTNASDPPADFYIPPPRGVPEGRHPGPQDEIVRKSMEQSPPSPEPSSPAMDFYIPPPRGMPERLYPGPQDEIVRKSIGQRP